MVAMIIFLMSMMPIFAIGSIDILKSDERYGGPEEEKLIAPVKKKKINKSINYKNSYERSEAQNLALKEKLNALSSNNSQFDFTNTLIIPTGTTLRGKLLNSVVSSNLTSPILVRIRANQYFEEGAKLACLGERSGRRIYVACDRVIIGEVEYSGLITSLLNIDGSNGLRGDYWSGEERYVTGIIATSLASGVILSAGDSTQTPYGNQVVNTGKNTVISGLASSADKAVGLMSEKLEKSSGVVTLEAGSEVLIYFNGGFYL